MMKKGEITVFVSLILAVLLFFFQACLQSARYALLRSQTEEALELAEYSVLSEYHRELLERYGLFYLDLGYGSREEDRAYLEQRIRQFLNENLGQGQAEEVIAREFSRATDGGGLAYYEQAVSYMKQRTGVSWLEKFREYESLGIQAEESAKAYEEADAREQSNLEELNRRQQEQELETAPNPSSELETLKRSSILQLVLQEPDRVSGKKAELSSAPSARTLLAGAGPRGRNSANAANDMLFMGYLLERFPNAVDFLEEEKDPGSWLDYQAEYLIAGKDTDIDNLEAVCGRILAMREGANYLSLLSDSGKVAECEALAAAMAGVLLFPEIIEVLKQLLLLCWAFSESVLDVRMLLNGNKTAFFKTSDTWKLSLSQAFALQEALPLFDGSSDAQGLEYADYLGILLTLTGREKKTMRSLNAIEGVIRGISGGSGFCIDQCVDGFWTEVRMVNGRELSAQRWFCYEW